MQDNLPTHSTDALYQTFPAAEARSILRRLEFHYTPKHASWLSMVEIEVGVLRGQSLERRIDDPMRLRREIVAWERRGNAGGAHIKWMFTTDKARTKMGRAYPHTSRESYSTSASVMTGLPVRSAPARLLPALLQLLYTPKGYCEALLQALLLLISY